MKVVGVALINVRIEPHMKATPETKIKLEDITQKVLAPAYFAILDIIGFELLYAD